MMARLSLCVALLLSLLYVASASTIVPRDTLMSGSGTTVTSKHRVGPFLLGTETKSFPISEAPYASDAEAIQYWGDWVVYDADNNVVPTGVVFLHHIMLYGSVMGRSILVTGSSDERATFGPNLFGRFVMPTKDLHVSGSVLLVGYREPQQYWIEYTVRYFTVDNMPEKPIPVTSVQSTFSMNVPMLGPDQIHSQSTMFTMPQNGILLTGVGHMHVGAVGASLIEKDTKEEVCRSSASHFTMNEHPCFIECPSQCTTGGPVYPALKSIERCIVGKWYAAGTTFDLQVSYDAVCQFNDCHAHLYMWYAPMDSVDLV